LNLRFLETFIWVARLRSFSVAAERMGTTQAAVSNRIISGFAAADRKVGH
jgi:DNA-binding transcriptional LysR family regulator